MGVRGSTSSYTMYDYTTTVHMDLYSTYVLYIQYTHTHIYIYIHISTQHIYFYYNKNVRGSHL
jgi:hypothetical protein